MEIMATSKNYGKKKKVRITSGIFWTLMGKNLIMEKSDAGAACLSWTFFFFHNSVGDHNSLNYTPSIPQKIRLDLKEQIATKNIREIAVCSGMLHNHLTNQTIVFRFKCRQNPVKQNYQMPLKSYWILSNPVQKSIEFPWNPINIL